MTIAREVFAILRNVPGCAPADAGKDFAISISETRQENARPARRKEGHDGLE